MRIIVLIKNLYITGVKTKKVLLKNGRRRPIKPKLRNNIALFHSRDFSDVEDSPQGLKIIERLVSDAGIHAAAEAQAAGLPLVFSRSNKIIRRHIDGTEEVLTTTSAENPFYISYNKGTVLHARKK